jgi:hypothetical protein
MVQQRKLVFNPMYGNELDGIRVHDCIPVSQLHPSPENQPGYVILGRAIMWDGKRQTVKEDDLMYFSQHPIEPKTHLKVGSSKIEDIQQVFPNAVIKAMMLKLKEKRASQESK